MHAVKRPVIISIVCIMGFIGSLFSFLWVFSPFIKNLGDWYPALFGIINTCGFVAYIGVWHMKRWGIHLYAVAFFSRTSIYILIDDMGTFTIIGIIVSVIFITVMSLFYKRMDVNL